MNFDKPLFTQATVFWLPFDIKYWGIYSMPVSELELLSSEGIDPISVLNSGCNYHLFSDYNYFDIHVESRALVELGGDTLPVGGMLLVNGAYPDAPMREVRRYFPNIAKSVYETYADIPFDFFKPHRLNAEVMLWNHGDCFNPDGGAKNVQCIVNKVIEWEEIQPVYSLYKLIEYKIRRLF